MEDFMNSFFVYWFLKQILEIPFVHESMCFLADSILFFQTKHVIYITYMIYIL